MIPGALAPSAVPVALKYGAAAADDRGFVLDTSDDETVGWAYAPRLRDAIYQQDVGDEQALSLEGTWRRTRDSWRLGDLQDTADKANSEDERAASIKHCLPWAEEGLIPVPDFDKETAFGDTALGTDITVVPVRGSDRGYVVLQEGASGAGKLWEADGTSQAASVTLWPDYTRHHGVATDGEKVWWGGSNTGYRVYRGDGFGSAITTVTTDAKTYAVGVHYANGRLVAWETGNLYDLTSIAWSSGTWPTAEHSFDSGYVHSVVGGQYGLLVCVVVGGGTTVYRWPMKADGTGLDVPVQVARLNGEVMVGAFSHYGYLILSLSVGALPGVRFMRETTDGLVFGPMSPNVGRIVGAGFTAYRELVIGASHYSGSATGIHVWNLGNMVAENQPAHYFLTDAWPRGSTTGDAIDYALTCCFDNRLIAGIPTARLVVGGLDLGSSYRRVHRMENTLNETSSLRYRPSSDAQMETGWFTFGSPTMDKVPLRITAAFDPLAIGSSGFYAFYVDYDNQSGYSLVQTFTTASVGTTTVALDPTKTFKRLKVKVVWDAGPSGTIARFRSITVEAFPNPPRQRRIVLPVKLHRVVVDGYGREWGLDVEGHKSWLRARLEAGDRVYLRWAESPTATDAAVIESLEWRPVREGQDGTMFVTLVTV